jgi:sRNA-binding regulator protein Hfq
MLKKGQYVKLVFRNSTQLEGLVETWENNTAVLVSKDQKSKMIVLNISSDVMAIKVSLDDDIQPEKPQPQEHASKSKVEDLQDKFEEVKSAPSQDNLRIKNLADLRTMIINEEKNIVREKLRSHYPTTVGQSYYGNPFTKKPSAK